jgi:hypothetical protein
MISFKIRKIFNSSYIIEDVNKNIQSKDTRLFYPNSNIFSSIVSREKHSYDDTAFVINIIRKMI